MWGNLFFVDMVRLGEGAKRSELPRVCGQNHGEGWQREEDQREKKKKKRISLQTPPRPGVVPPFSVAKL